MAMTIVTVDVSSLPPPEPMSVILATLATLPEHHAIQVVHRREPLPLYQRLVDNGWHYQTMQKSADCYLIYIVRASDRQSLTHYLKAQNQ